MISGLGQSAELSTSLHVAAWNLTDRHQHTADRISAEICVYLRFARPQLRSRLA
jgi:hypothetical protein